MNQINVHNDRSKQNQTQRDETSDKQEQAANDLEHGDDVKIVAQEKSLREVSDQPGGWRWHRNEVQKNIGTENNKNQSEKDPGDDGSNFHLIIVA